MDGLILGTMSIACDALQGAGAQKLWFDVCVSTEGAGILYYGVIAFYVVLAMGVIGAVGNRLGKRPADEPADRQEPL